MNKHERPQILLVSRGFVFDAANHFLLIRRSERDRRNPGLWECPGGKLDKGQELHRAFEREVMEETGLLVEPTEHMAYVDGYVVDKGPYEGMPYVSIFSIGKSIGGKLQLSEEHIDSAWVTSDEALDYDLTPETRKALIVLEKHLGKEK
ncbi:NUDIX domain-containing protein [Candidatus Wolfebacteria bacterium]|nr:NUDIX domain-containing protein [Candidatus Wolfebacteria bacterium]